MSITEVTTEVIDPTGVNSVVGNHIEAPSKGRGDNKAIIETNTKATIDNFIPPTEAITIIYTMAIMRQRWLWPWQKLFQTLHLQKRQSSRP